MSDALHISNGRVHDPANGVDGEVADVFVLDGAIVDTLPPDVLPRRVDATGMIVTPGGVEMHSHIASMPVNAARAIQSACGYDRVVPTAPDTGRCYAALGYTTAVEAAVAPRTAAHAHLQLDEIPNIDAGLLLLMGNHEAIIDRLSHNDQQGARAIVQQLLAQCGALGIKAVNPAAISAWRRNPSQDHINSIDDTIAGTSVSPRVVLELLTDAHEQLKLAHPTHIHGPQLGEPGNVDITLDMCKSIAGRRFHLAHLQYYAYGKTRRGAHVSDASRLAGHLADHRQVTFDLGLVAFGPAFTATADLPLEFHLHQHAGSPARPAMFCETGNEDAFGVMPLVHDPANPVHAMQWAVGLELALLMDTPWQYALTVDHPNGGSFRNYPELIAQLMSRPLRDEQLARCHKHARDRTGLAGLSREMTLREIIIITRVAPARALGLSAKGHIGPGADADIVIYDANLLDQPHKMFEAPRYVIKGGQVLVAEGQLTGQTVGRRLRCDVAYSEHGQALLDARRDGDF